MILAIETATDICGVALVNNHAVLAHRFIAEKNVHSEKLLPMIDEVLKEAAITLRNVNAVALSIGPGSFTGLRIGLSTAKGLAMAAELPLIPVPTLDALALEYHRNGSNSAAIICSLIDAKRDEAFFSFYSIQNGIPFRRSEYEIASAQAIAEKAKQFPSVIFVGDGVGKIKAAAGENGAVQFVAAMQFRGDVVCSAASVGLLAEEKFLELKTEEYSMLEPLYLREFVATQPPAEKQNASQFSSGTKSSTQIRLRRTHSS